MFFPICGDERETIWIQPTVTFPIGSPVNVLHDYKKILNLLPAAEMLVEFCQNVPILTI